MAAQFSRSILKVSVAQICQNVGWHAVHQSTLELLVDILHRYMLEVAKSAQAYSNHYGSTEPDLYELSMAFGDLGILVSELEEYVSNVEPVQFAESRLPHFPVSRSSTSSSGNRLHHWVHEFPTHSTDIGEEEELAMSPGAPDGGGPSPRKEGAAGAMNSAGEEMVGSPDASPQPSKRTSDGGDTPTPKRFRLCVEEEGQPMREVTSVFMTPSGLISPAREGKLPEPSLPSRLIAVDEVASDSLDSIDLPRKEIKFKDAKKALKKEPKKVKPSKKDKENAELKKALFFPVGKGTHSIFKLKKKLNKKARFQKELIAPKLKIKEAKSKNKASKGKEEKKEGKNKEGKSKEGRVKEKSKSKKNKGDHTLPGTSSAATPGQSPKLSKGKSPVKTKSPARAKSPKGEKKKTVTVAPIIPIPSAPPLSPPVPPFIISNMTPLQVMACKAEEERLRLNAAGAGQQAALPPEEVMKDELYDIPSREESPEPRLIIDDSPEMISKQERESRLADIEQCIDAVIQKAREETIEEEKRESAAEALLVHGAMVPRKLEPRDVYDFTDSDSDSSMPPTPKTPDLAASPNPKKETKTPPDVTQTERKKKEGGKAKRKSGGKTKSGTPSPKKGLPKTPELRGSPLVALSQRAESPERGPSFLGVFPFSQHGSLFSPRFPGSGVMGPPLGPQQQQQSGFLPSFPFSHMGRSGAAFPTPPLFVPPTSRGPSTDVTSPGSSPPMNLSSSAFPVKTVAEKKGVPSLSPVPPKLSKEAPVIPKSHGDTEKGKGMEQKEKSLQKKKAKEGKSNKKSKTKPGKEKKSKEEKKDDSIPKITVKLASKPSATKLLLKAMTQTKEPSQPPEESPSRRSPSPPLLSPSVPPPSAPAAPPVGVPTLGKSGSKGGTKGPSSSTSATTSKAAVSRQGPSPQPPVPPQQPEPPCSLPAARMVVTETVGTIVDERGNKIWICPACARPDDGSPMIGCDECDDWYHWVCVGIVVPPKEEESWFCNRCIARRQGALAKKKKKKHRKDK